MIVDMHTIHPAGTSENGRFSITHKIYKPTIRERMSSEFLGQQEGDNITILRDHKTLEIVMSDSMMERRTNSEFIRNANGDVLIAGLGLGMIVLAIQDKPEVRSITVVELEQELHDLVMSNLKSHLNDKVQVVICDIHNFNPSSKFDSIYCDIWNTISSDNWDEMKKLTKKFKRFVNRSNDKSFLDHWRKKDVQKLYYEG